MHVHFDYYSWVASYTWYSAKVVSFHMNRCNVWCAQGGFVWISPVETFLVEVELWWGRANAICGPGEWDAMSKRSESKAPSSKSMAPGTVASSSTLQLWMQVHTSSRSSWHRFELCGEWIRYAGTDCGQDVAACHRQARIQAPNSRCHCSGPEV